MAGHIKINQTWLEFAVNVEHDITNCTAKILYKKPNGLTGEWSATITNATTGLVIFTTFIGTTLDIVGNWIGLAQITNQAGKVVKGDAFQFTVYDPYTLIH